MINDSKNETENEKQITKIRYKQTYNPDHNILELYNSLVQIRFTKSKRKLDIQYNKLGVRVASRVAEQLKTQEIRKYQKNLKFVWRHSLVPSLPSRTQTLPIAVKKTRKNRYKTFVCLSRFAGLLHFVPKYCPGLQVQTWTQIY